YTAVYALFVSGAAGDFDAGGGGVLPAGWQERAEIVLVGHARQAAQDVGEVNLGVEAVAAGTFDHRVDDRAALAGGFATKKEPVLLADSRWPDAVLDEIGVDFKL